jgi:hypothetical protein
VTVLALGGASMTLDEAVEALREIGAEPAMRHDRAGREYWAHRCAHPDHRDSWPSATITADERGNLLLNCFSCAPAGGSHARTRWVAQVLGRLHARLPKEPPSGSSRARSGTGNGGWGVKVAHYDYVTADGHMEARKVRFEPKSFLWQRPYADGWADGLNRRPLNTLPLYGLHSLTNPGPVLVVEGEKDADRAHTLGLAAVCAPGSHARDIPDDLTPLDGRTIIVVADRDKVGIELAHSWRERLPTAHLAQPKVPTPKADLSDHFDAGYGLTDLDFGPVPQLPPEPDPTPALDLPANITDELAADRLLNDEVAMLLRRERAKAILTEIRERANPKPAPDCGTVEEILARPEAEKWRIEKLLPAGARMLFTAQRKTGKTTAVGNLSRSLLDGVPFLGHFHTTPITGKVGVLNYEVTGAQFARWMDDIGVPGHRMYVENLRGCTNPLTTEEGRAELVARLRAHEVEVLIVDPFGRAYHGRDQNDAAQVTPWLVMLDQVAEMCGATELILTAHAGWNGERTRGSSALEDWPDVIVTLTKDAETTERYIRADGRDVDLDEDRIEYHELTRTYTLTGDGSKNGAADRRNADRLVAGLVDLLGRRTDISVSAIARAWRDEGFYFTNGDEQRASREAVERGLVTIYHGPRGAKLHRLAPPPPTSSDLLRGPGPTSPLPTEGVVGGSEDERAAEEVKPPTALGLFVSCRGCQKPTHPNSNPCTECRRS